ncbi:hypothetical protein DdX_14107 [Ditylenchus destructor]|uniref:F-box domain-containing protein n=1 Tax=Ditylenchus destructor TaxID=166010 RepID=A0AAD4MXE1_9BILA|nr:hypothetical protein DdX_14107 [Ditylenchus destructor]
MSCSKPVPSYVFDSLYYLNRDQLERFSIVCRPLKNFIERYFHSKPFRIFNGLRIRGGKYALHHKNVQWHPNRDDYNIQQFLANQKCIVDEYKRKNVPIDRQRVYYSFAEMIPYLSLTVRINWIEIRVTEDVTYNPEQISELESIAYLWRDGNISIENAGKYLSIIRAEDFQLILNSPTILQCRQLYMYNAHFSFKDYKILYALKIFEILYYPYEEDDDYNDDYIDDSFDSNYWAEFVEQPGVKPVVVLNHFPHRKVVDMIDLLSKAFESADLPNAFKVVFEYEFEGQITEFRETNSTSGEKLELKTVIPLECQEVSFDYDYYCTLERSSI